MMDYLNDIERIIKENNNSWDHHVPHQVFSSSWRFTRASAEKKAWEQRRVAGSADSVFRNGYHSKGLLDHYATLAT